MYIHVLVYMHGLVEGSQTISKIWVFWYFYVEHCKQRLFSLFTLVLPPTRY